MSMMCIDFGLNSFLCRNLPLLSLDIILIGLILMIIGILLNQGNN